jgi:hypothetical protein
VLALTQRFEKKVYRFAFIPRNGWTNLQNLSET